MQEELKKQEMAQRKTNQELEALQFRNQQLAKRVEVLQQDLDAAHSATNKKRGLAGVMARGTAAGAAPEMAAPDQALIMEQLQTEIEEKARLTSQARSPNISFSYNNYHKNTYYSLNCTK